MKDRHEYWLAALFFSVMMLTVARMVPGQVLGPPPIHGFNGTLALPESVDKFYDGLNTGLEKVGDGIDHVTRRSNTPDMNGGQASLEELKPGTAVVVQYTVKGFEASSAAADSSEAATTSPNHGTVTSVDRSKGRIAIRFNSGVTEVFRSADEPDRHSSRVIVYRSGEST